jgi:putative CocE/NonD family hydrolase
MTRYWRAEEGRQPGLPGSEGDPVRFWASHGFAVIVGDVRGTGASFGVWPHHRSRDETRDFSEIMDWIAAQPWSDGQVAGFGTSYNANTADWLPERNHPALKAVVSRFPDYDPFADLYFPGGVPNAYMGRAWGLEVKDMDLNVKRQYSDGPRGVKPVDGNEGARLLAAAIEARRHLPSVWEALSRITYRDDRPDQWGGWSMDDWGIHSWHDAVERSGVPIQSWGSWMDAGTANGVLHRFMTITNPQRVFVGAWSHGGDHDASPYQREDADPNPPFRVQFLEDLCFSSGTCVGAIRVGARQSDSSSISRWVRSCGKPRRHGRHTEANRSGGTSQVEARSCGTRRQLMTPPTVTPSTSRQPRGRRTDG